MNQKLTINDASINHELIQYMNLITMDFLIKLYTQTKGSITGIKVSKELNQHYL